MARLQVTIEMVDDAGRVRLGATRSEPTRFDVDRDPLYVLARLQVLTEIVADELHEQALRINATAWPASRENA